MSSKAIQIQNLSKAYQLGEFSSGTISRDLQRYLARILGKEDPLLKIGETNDRSTKGKSDIVWSLKDISFEVEQGDAVGIIGRNGAGKSTLLKILSRVTSPTTGSIKVKGRIASLLEVGTGFHPELTGRENIYLNGAILGMRKAEITRKFDEIVDFSGVRRYIDTPVKRYSSGMYTRLAFAVAAYLESEILIVDEVLAVGDAEFQKKCLGKMNDVSRNEGRTILFVSHNLSSVMKLCNKGIILVNGEITAYDDVITAVQKYNSSDDEENLLEKTVNPNVYFNKIRFYDRDNITRTEFLHTEPIKIAFKLTAPNLDKHYRIFVTILNAQKNKIFSTEVDILEGKSDYELTINSHFLVRGAYSLNCFIHSPLVSLISEVEDYFNFTIIDDNSTFALYGPFDYGNVFGNCSWQ
ncbi:ATP-binding cassette domain-containing protein [Mucilaginibacter conchicola]|uniref:ATP-binding cassette domain-containing protein n=1 Tax=Mucilaginibacter conchicola TaxID=2303333 RepID=A0A372P095_9SPHI|nr:ABC transporter ATP-binding protein [Mucilaginibacter conchicola]RFZ95591.1 ATP-binding cassette domain-containing protein [Mucilaginibacter conchicola]